MSNMISTTTVLLLLVAAITTLSLNNNVLVLATEPPLINATKPFWQLNATRMLFSNEAPLAGWSKTPILNNVDNILFDSSSKRYVIMADNFSSVFSANEQDLKTNPAGAFFEHKNVSQILRAIYRENNKKKISSSSTRWIGTAVDPSQCISSVLTPQSCSGNEPQQSSSLLYLTAGGTMMHCAFAQPQNPTSFSCSTFMVTGDLMNVSSASQYNNLVISGAPVVQDKQVSAIFVSTSAGLFAIVSNGVSPQFLSKQIVLKNTEGNYTTSSNVTWMGCLPPRYYQDRQSTMMKKSSSHPMMKNLHQKTGGFPFPNTVEFFDADCFATTNEDYTKYGVEADLIHNIKGRSASDYGYVHPHLFERIPGIIDSRPTAASYTPYTRRMFFGNKESVSAMKHTGGFWRYGSLHSFTYGLPTNNILNSAWLDLSDAHKEIVALGGSTQDYEQDGVVFFGTPRGAIAKIPSSDDEYEEEGKWKLLLGGRWLPGGNDGTLTKGMYVSNFASGSNTVLCSTDTGFSLIYATVWTPAMKSNYYETVLAPKHQRADGLFADSHLKEWGNAWTAYNFGTANDGLWTGMRLVSEALRWVASGKTDQQARSNCWLNFRGMQTLINVTGVKGLMARSAWKSETSPGSGWVKSTAMPGWWFMPTASSDEVTGHMAAYTAMHDLVAENNAERAEAATFLNDVMMHIVNHGLILVDYNGVPTHWGHWEPADLNDNPFWYDDRGPNCIQILGWLSSSYRITGNKTFADTFNTLVNEYGYGRNLVNAKITQPTDDNYSDDELMMMAYFTLGMSARTLAWDPTTKNPLFQSVAQEAEESIYRHWKFVKKGKPSLWGAFYCILQPIYDINHQNEQRHKASRQEAIDAIWDNMVSWPIELVDWPIDNSQRLGVTWNPFDARNGQSHVILENLYPMDELSVFYWNGNPYSARQGSGGSEARPTGPLFPYYAALAAPYLTGNNI